MWFLALISSVYCRTENSRLALRRVLRQQHSEVKRFGVADTIRSKSMLKEELKQLRKASHAICERIERSRNRVVLSVVDQFDQGYF